MQARKPTSSVLNLEQKRDALQILVGKSGEEGEKEEGE